jgi:hypothetical protein
MWHTFARYLIELPGMHTVAGVGNLWFAVSTLTRGPRENQVRSTNGIGRDGHCPCRSRKRGMRVAAMVSYCDAPIQPDGSWQRCSNNTPVWGGAGWVGGSNCYQVGPGPDPYPWAPQYHIDP